MITMELSAVVDEENMPDTIQDNNNDKEPQKLENKEDIDQREVEVVKSGEDAQATETATIANETTTTNSNIVGDEKTKGKCKKKKSPASPSGDDSSSAAAAGEDVENNDKQQQQQQVIIPVSCGPNNGWLYLNRLTEGSRSLAVSFEGAWLTPNEFQARSGRRAAKDWKRSIKHHDKSLKALLASGTLDFAPPRCACAQCASGQSAPGLAEGHLADLKDSQVSSSDDTVSTTVALNKSNNQKQAGKKVCVQQQKSKASASFNNKNSKNPSAAATACDPHSTYVKQGLLMTSLNGDSRSTMTSDNFMITSSEELATTNAPLHLTTSSHNDTGNNVAVVNGNASIGDVTTVLLGLSSEFPSVAGESSTSDQLTRNNNHSKTSIRRKLKKKILQTTANSNTDRLATCEELLMNAELAVNGGYFAANICGDYSDMAAATATGFLPGQALFANMLSPNSEASLLTKPRKKKRKRIASSIISLDNNDTPSDVLNIGNGNANFIKQARKLMTSQRAGTRLIVPSWRRVDPEGDDDEEQLYDEYGALDLRVRYASPRCHDDDDDTGQLWDNDYCDNDDGDLAPVDLSTR